MILRTESPSGSSLYALCTILSPEDQSMPRRLEANFGTDLTAVIIGSIGVSGVSAQSEVLLISNLRVG